jgi:hypothetical protein
VGSRQVRALILVRVQARRAAANDNGEWLLTTIQLWGRPTRIRAPGAPFLELHDVVDDDGCIEVMTALGPVAGRGP